MNPRHLYRSADDRLVAGVAGGLAAYLDVDPVIVRIIWFLSMLLTGTVTLWIYLIMIVVVPLEPTEWPPQSPWAPGGAPIGSEAVTTPPTADTIPGSAAGVAGSGPSATPAAGPSAAFGGTPPPAAGGWWSGDWRAQTRQALWQQRAERDEYRGFRRALASSSGSCWCSSAACWHGTSSTPASISTGSGRSRSSSSAGSWSSPRSASAGRPVRQPVPSRQSGCGGACVEARETCRNRPAARRPSPRRARSHSRSSPAARTRHRKG